MRQIMASLIVVLSLAAGCMAPHYLSVPPADPVGQDRRLSPSLPEQAIVRDQHLGQLHVELRYLEEALVRIEQQRLEACRTPEATQVNSLAYQRCQLKDQLYEQAKVEVAGARDHYLRAVSGRGGSSR